MCILISNNYCNYQHIRDTVLIYRLKRGLQRNVKSNDALPINVLIFYVQ